MFNIKKFLAAAVSVCMLGTALTGCGDEIPDSGDGNTIVTEGAAVKAGQTFEASLDTPYDYNGLSITLGGVCETDKSPNDTYFLACLVTIDNFTDEDKFISLIDDFVVYVDGAVYETAAASTGARLSCKKSEKYGQYEAIDGDIAAGSSKSGVYAIEIPKSWSSLEIRFTPDRKVITDQICFKITSSDVTYL